MTNKVEQKCTSCGTDNSQHRHKTWAYCARCELERKDNTVRPLFWEYIGPQLGCLPNKRDVPYGLMRMGFQERLPLPCGVHSLLTFIREDDGSPMGQIAIMTLDGYVVIVNGKQELDVLFSHLQFADMPTIDNLPEILLGVDRHNLDMVIAAQAKMN